jgi:hypothetical protein
MFAIWLESLTSSWGDNVNNLDFDHPRGWAKHLEARDWRRNVNFN